MKALLKFTTFCALILVSSDTISATPRAGFYMPDSIQEVSIKFKNFNNLIILPVIINDSIHVNLVLDTGCRNLVLFGKKFTSYFSMQPDKKVQFAGLGEGHAITGSLSLNNKVSIGAVLGERIPIVVVSKQTIFGCFDQIDGVIGYDVFIRFEIEMNPLSQHIIFRPALLAPAQKGYTQVPVHIEDSRPLLTSTIFFDENNQICDLMIDTGSSIGLLLKTTDLQKFKTKNSVDKIIGRGFNGFIKGFDLIADKLLMTDFEMTQLPVSVTHSPWHNHASIGMSILKDYALILNYCKGYAAFKKL